MLRRLSGTRIVVLSLLGIQLLIRHRVELNRDDMKRASLLLRVKEDAGHVCSVAWSGRGLPGFGRSQNHDLTFIKAELWRKVRFLRSSPRLPSGENFRPPSGKYLPTLSRARRSAEIYLRIRMQTPYGKYSSLRLFAALEISVDFQECFQDGKTLRSNRALVL